MIRTLYKLSLFMSLAFLLALVCGPEQAYAQWPPFDFRMVPAHENGQINYRIRFSNEVDWVINNVTFKIVLPKGTRFLQADAQSGTQSSFDGTTITFFTANVPEGMIEASFRVEIDEPNLTVFTTQAWIAWQGDQPGEYTTADVSTDVTQQPLNWDRPGNPRLQLDASATVADGIITYVIYPRKSGGLRMWDVKINVPLPEGTTFLSAEVLPPFTASFDGREVSFFILELGEQAEISPLSFKVAISEVTPPLVATHAWASWKNAGRRVGTSIVIEEQTVTGDIMVQPHTAQRVLADGIGDVPFANYDLTSIALQEEDAGLKVTFYTAGDLGVVGEPLDYSLFLDSDCSPETGSLKNERGVEYYIRYRHSLGEADLRTWDEVEKRWIRAREVNLNSSVSGKAIMVQTPYSSLKDGQHFCWIGEAKNGTQAFYPAPPNDQVPNNNRRISGLTQYEAIPALTTGVPSPVGLAATVPITSSGQPTGTAPLITVNVPALPITAAMTPTGKLAIPLDNGQVLYDVHIFSLPEGQEMTKIANARQPNFRFDGQRLLINHEGGGVENVFEYNFGDGTERQVSDAPRDAHPFYDLWGNRVVYGNSELTVGPGYVKRLQPEDYSNRSPYIFVQCSLAPPHQETESRCRNIAWLGVLVPAGQMGELQGTHPVWTTNDMIAYKGCNSWAGASACGIYIVPSASTKGFSNGFIPRQLTQYSDDIPSDTKGNWIAFTSRRDGNWEAYLMDLNGANVRNLSNSSTSNDGLPTLSPDGNWVAFVSDRSGQWAVWAVPIAGGSAQKLFDLPNDRNIWGDHDRSWTNERISWGANQLTINN